MAKPILTTQRIVTIPEVQRSNVPENLVIHELPNGQIRLMIGDQEVCTCLRVDLVAALDLLK